MSIQVGTTLPKHTLSTLALNVGLSGANKSEILRYAVLVALGKDSEDARQMALAKRAPSTLSKVGTIAVRIDDDTYSQLCDRFPGMTGAQLLRYVTAIAAGCDEEQAKDFAIVPLGPKPKKKTAGLDGGDSVHTGSND